MKPGSCTDRSQEGCTQEVVRFLWPERGGFQYRRSLGWILLYALSEYSRLLAECFTQSCSTVSFILS